MVSRKFISELILSSRMDSLLRNSEGYDETLAQNLETLRAVEIERAANISQVLYDQVLHRLFECASALEKHRDLTTELHMLYKDLSIWDQVRIEHIQGVERITKHFAFHFVQKKLDPYFLLGGLPVDTSPLLMKLDMMLNEVSLNGASSPLVMEFLYNLSNLAPASVFFS